MKTSSHNETGFSFIEVLLVIIVLVVLTVLGSEIWHAQHVTDVPVSDSSKTNSQKVMDVYSQTADKMAGVISSGIPGTALYSMQALSVKPASVSYETNEVKKLYCFTANNSPSLTEQVINGFENDSSATWTAGTATSGSGSNTTTIYAAEYEITPTNSDPNAFAEALEPLITTTGNVNISFYTDIDAVKPITTSNPNYYPSGIADAGISLPTQTNQCTALAAQDNVNTVNKVILSITLDFSDDEGLGF